MRRILTGALIGAGLGLVYALVMFGRVIHATHPSVRYIRQF